MIIISYVKKKSPFPAACMSRLWEENRLLILIAMVSKNIRAKVEFILHFFSHLPFSLSTRMLSMIVSIAATASACVTNTHKADPKTGDYDWSVTQPKLHDRRTSVVIVQPRVTDYMYVLHAVLCACGIAIAITTLHIKKIIRPTHACRLHGIR